MIPYLTSGRASTAPCRSSMRLCRRFASDRRVTAATDADNEGFYCQTASRFVEPNTVEPFPSLSTWRLCMTSTMRQSMVVVPNPAAGSTTEQRRMYRGGIGVTIPSVALPAPVSMTHEHLAYAQCPLCRVNVHMCDMYQHLTGKHKELNPKHCHKICNDRLTLYERAIGAPLVKFANTHRKDDATVKLLDLLPTLLEGGGYLCNWCERSDAKYPTRDSFFRHVMKDHPEVELEEIEGKIPHNNSKVTRNTANTSHSDEATPPRRRLPAIAVKPDYTASLPPLPPAPLPPAPQGSKPPPPPANLNWSADNWPCEICGRCFPVELSLLNHLESSHPFGVANEMDEMCNTNRERLASADIARYQQLELHTDLKDFSAACDLCSSKVALFSRPSALYAHIRLKHPEELRPEEALDRMIRKSSEVVRCPSCKKIFASKGALEAHFSEKHSRTLSLSRTTGLKQVDLTCSWWCHECEKGFASPRALHCHLTTKHGMPSQVIPCPACKRVFSDVFSLKEHVALIHKSLDAEALDPMTMSTCVECSRNFISRGELEKHQRKHHRGADGLATAKTGKQVVSAPVAGDTEALNSPTEAAAPVRTAPRVVARRSVAVDSTDEKEKSIRPDDVSFV